MLNFSIKFLNLILFVLVVLFFFLNDKSFNQSHDLSDLKAKYLIDSSEEANMETLNTVEIDSRGLFKYIMIEVVDPNTQSKKLLIRGYCEANYHADIAENFTRDLECSGRSHLKVSILGGGRILHDPDSKKINVYGYSVGYGKANHELAAQLIKDKFPEYAVTWTDDDKY